MVIYPNPSEGIVTVLYNDRLEPNYTVELMDLTGKVLYQAQRQDNDEENSDFSIDLSDFAGGIYFIQINSGGQTFVQKLVIDRR